MRTDGHSHALSTVQELLAHADNTCYCIPYYQRVGVWGKDNVIRLVADIVDGASDFCKAADKDASWTDTFIGTMIFLSYCPDQDIHPCDLGTSKVPVFKVVDGQQRLSALGTTCIVLHKFLADRLKLVVKYCGEGGSVHRRVHELMGTLAQCAVLNYPSIAQAIPRMIWLNEDSWPSRENPGVYGAPASKFVADAFKLPNLEAREFDMSAREMNDRNRAFSANVKELANRVSRICTGPKNVLMSDVVATMNIPLVKHNLFKLAVTSDEELQLENKQLHPIYRALMFCEYMLSHVQVLWMLTHNEEDAMDIFESLNATGVLLTSIETFKPAVVSDIGQDNYRLSLEKVQFDKVEHNLGSGETDRAKYATETVASLALAEHGSELPNRRIRAQRALLRNAYGECANNDLMRGKDIRDERQELIRHLACSSEVVSAILRTKSEDDEQIGKVQLLGIEGLSLAYVQDLGHSSCIPMLARLYHKYTSAADDLSDAGGAASGQINEAVKYISAYYALTRLTGDKTGNIDSTHKAIMSLYCRAGGKSISAKQIRQELSSRFAVRMDAFLRIQEEYDSDSLGPPSMLRDAFIKKCQSVAIYRICQKSAKFVLLAYGVGNDALSRRAWFSEQTATLCHLVPESGAQGESDRLGNQMLLSKSTRARVYKLHNAPTKWKQLNHAYKELGTDSQIYISTKMALETYFSNSKNGRPDHNLIQARGVKIAERAWDLLAKDWLGLDS